MTDCFRTSSNVLINVTFAGDVPCANTIDGFSQCCRKGDQCLEDGICHFTRGGVGTSGYYIASCTDPSAKDSSCLQTCNGNGYPDIVYSQADQLWHCCEAETGTGSTNCSNPTDDTFQAPAPDNLVDFASSTPTSTSSPGSLGTSSSITSPLPSSPSSSTSPSRPLANGASSTSTSSSTPSSDSGLSAGAKAGIGVGVALGAVCIVLLSIIIFLMRKRQRRQQATALAGDGSKGIQEGSYRGKGNAENRGLLGDRQGRQELPEQATKSELDSSRSTFHEIEG